MELFKEISEDFENKLSTIRRTINRSIDERAGQAIWAISMYGALNHTLQEIFNLTYSQFYDHYNRDLIEGVYPSLQKH